VSDPFAALLSEGVVVSTTVAVQAEAVRPRSNNATVNREVIADSL
jgi:hypothetical protein